MPNPNARQSKKGKEMNLQKGSLLLSRSRLKARGGAEREEAREIVNLKRSPCGHRPEANYFLLDNPFNF